METVKIDKYPTYKDSGVEWIEDIPSHWEVKKFKRVFYEIKKRSNPELNCGSISFGKVIYKDDEKIPESTKRSYQVVLKGDFLVNPLNLNYDLISLRIALSEIDVVVSSGYIVLSNLVKLDKNYYKYFLHRFDVAYMKLLGSGVRQTLNYNDIANCDLIFPPIKEQTAIATFLDRKTAQIDKAISTKERQIELLKERRQILIHQAVTRGLNPNVKMKDSGVEWVGEIPEHWEVKRLKMLLKNEKGALKPGPFGSDLKGSDIIDIGYKVYNQRAVLDSDYGVSGECISARKYKDLDTFKVRKDDILLTSRGTIGRCFIIPAKYEEGIIHPCIIRLRFDNNSVNNIYIKHYIEWSIAFQASLKMNSNATTIDVIYGITLSNSLFIIPPKAEQTTISQYIESTNQKFITAISLKARQIERLKEYKATLINSAVTGKIKVS